MTEPTPAQIADALENCCPCRAEGEACQHNAACSMQANGARMIRALAAERDEALAMVAAAYEAAAEVTQDQGQPSYEELADRIEELEANLVKSVLALIKIANKPSAMIWGEGNEVRETMDEMEKVAMNTLAELKGQGDAAQI